MSNIIFPTLVSSNWKLTRTPMWETMVQKSSSGKLTRAALQSSPIWKWTLKNGVLQSKDTVADLQAIETLYLQMFGRYDSFLWRDPEWQSLVPGFDTLYSVAFESDSIDFDRLCHQIWELGELSFRQVKATPTLIPAGSGATGSVLTVTSAALSSITSFVNSSGAPAIPTITSSLGGIFTDTTGNTYGVRTDSATYPAPTLASLQNMTVTAMIDGTVFSDGTPATFNIFDLSLTVTLADSSTVTVRPTSATASSNTTTGLVTDAANAIDGDPGTFASIVRSHYSGITSPGYIQFSGFQVS